MKKSDLIIKNIHTSSRFPELIYAEVWGEDGFICAATLGDCTKLVQDLVIPVSGDRGFLDPRTTVGTLAQ